MRSSDDLHEDVAQREDWKLDWGEDGTASFSGHERNHFFLNLHGQQFMDIAAIAGLDDDHDSRVWSRIDFDRDGLLDIALVNSNAPTLELFENRIDASVSPEAVGNYVAIRLIGGGGGEWSNRDAVGSKLSVDVGDERVLVREHRRGEGFSGHNSATELVGIGDAEAALVTIRWPSGKSTTVHDVAAGSRVDVFENPADSPDGSGVTRARYAQTTALAEDATRTAGTNFALASAKGRSESSRLRMYTTMATWCESCKKHNPHLGELREALEEPELALFGVPIDENDTADALRTYQAENAPGYDLLVALTEGDREVTKTLLAQHVPDDVLPSSIVTNAGGRVLMVKQGLPSVSELRALLSESASATSDGAAADAGRPAPSP